MSEFTREDMCVFIHTAMRKYCDSNITTAAYNAVHLIVDVPIQTKANPWILLGEITLRELHLCGEPIKAFRLAVSGLRETWEDRRRKEWLDSSTHREHWDVARPWLYMLNSILLAFDESDIEGAAALLPTSEDLKQASEG